MRAGLDGPPLRVLLAVAFAAVVGCSPAPTPPPSVPVALAPVEVIAVGEVRQGAPSDQELTIHVMELVSDSLPRGPGELQLVLTDSAGGRDAVSFTGTPTVTAPGSLEAKAVLTRANVLTIQVADTDTLNVEGVTIAGLRISASATAPVGPLGLMVGACSGSLAGCTANPVLPSPGIVVTP